MSAKRQKSHGIATWILLDGVYALLLVLLLAYSAFEWKHHRRADALTELTIWLVPLLCWAIVCFLWTRLVIRWRKRDKVNAVSLAGKKCDYCGGDAVATDVFENRPSYWCYDCQSEAAAIFIDLAAAERPDLMQPGQSKEVSVLLALRSDPGFRPCYEKLCQRATEILREKKRPR